MRKMSKEEKVETQKLVYIVVVPVEQEQIKNLEFGGWLKLKRKELMKEFDAKTVTISVFGKAVYIIGVERSTEAIDKIGFKRFLYGAREKLMKRFNTKQAFVVAI